MKILAFGNASPDYMQDDLFHGLSCVDNVEVETNVDLAYLFDDYAGDIKQLYGCGISYARNIPARKRHVVDNFEMIGKLSSGYYDLVIYLSARRCLNLYEAVVKFMPVGSVFFVDGEDDTTVVEYDGLTFKRELTRKPTVRLQPISFGIPSSKIVTAAPDKVRLLSDQLPSPDRKYRFSCEREYYAEYQGSRFAVTTQKAGWDCKRHYEILACACIPVFRNILSCPEHTCTTLPKKLLSLIEREWNHMSVDECDYWQAELLEFTRRNLTTEALARYVLSKSP